MDFTNLDEVFPEDFSEEQITKAKTLFLKKMSEDAHKFYGGKIQTVPKAGVFGFNWFNIWYTPGVSKENNNKYFSDFVFSFEHIFLLLCPDVV